MSDARTTPKQRWRQELRSRLQCVNQEQRTRDSESIRSRLLALPEWHEARAVMLFCPQSTEPDVMPLWERASASGKIVAFPSFLATTGDYAPRAVAAWSCGARLVPGAFGILEPPRDAPLLSGNQLDFIVVPGLGFAADGRRLGRGRGFYDRLLASLKGFRCGVAFDEQIVDDLPTEPHDRRLDCILTPSHEWLCPQART